MRRTDPTIKICDLCRRSVTTSIGNNDVVHECHSGNAVIDTEDVVILGDWEDYTGSGTVAASLLQTVGNTNKVGGTIAGQMGVFVPDLNNRGNVKGKVRARQRLRTIEFDTTDCE